MNEQTVNLMGEGKANGKPSTRFNLVFDDNKAFRTTDGKPVGDGKGIIIHIPDVAGQLAGLPKNDKGNRALNVYHKISGVAKFSGNLIYAG